MNEIIDDELIDAVHQAILTFSGEDHSKARVLDFISELEANGVVLKLASDDE